MAASEQQQQQEKCARCGDGSMPMIKVPCNGRARPYHPDCYEKYTVDVVKSQFSRAGKAYYILYHHTGNVMLFTELQRRFAALTGEKRALNMKELVRSWGGEIFSIVSGDYIALKEKISATPAVFTELAENTARARKRSLETTAAAADADEGTAPKRHRPASSSAASVAEHAPQTTVFQARLVDMRIPCDAAADIEKILVENDIEMDILRYFSFDKLVAMGISNGYAMRIVQYFRRS